MNICKKYILYGTIFRYVITIILLYILSLYYNNNIINKYFYLILPILLTLLDATDNIFTIYNNSSYCHKTFFYQFLDKICDSVSYLLLFLFFKLDNILLYFIFYRIIGVLLFSITKNSKWLILFFDFAKEYLFYIFLFGKNYIYMPIFIICKIVFEYYLHTKVNNSHY